MRLYLDIRCNLGAVIDCYSQQRYIRIMKYLYTLLFLSILGDSISQEVELVIASGVNYSMTSAF